MKAISLFSGLGGIDLAGEWAGIQTVAFCEREPFPRRVLAHHWPGIPIYDDVCTLTKEVLEEDGIISGTRAIDLVSAGFPCQPFSHAGQRGGTDDERYLWPEVVRILQDVKPTWFIGENVAGILSMAEPDGAAQVESRILQPGPEEDFYEAVFTQQEIMLFGNICKDLENIGYQVQPFVVPAAAVGAKHLRERVFIVGHSERFRRNGESRRRAEQESSDGCTQFSDGIMGHTAGAGLSERGQSGRTESQQEAAGRLEPEPERPGETMADSQSFGWNHGNDSKDQRTADREINAFADTGASPNENVAHTECGGLERPGRAGNPSNQTQNGHGQTSGHQHDSAGTTQSGMGGSIDEFSAWLDGCGVNPLDAFAEYIAAYPQPAPLGMDQYNWEPPRAATGVKERTGRLKALGNAVDPLQIYPVLAAVKMINDRFNNEGLF